MMTFYNDMSISDFLDYASASSDEMASLGNGRMIDYETGKYFEVKDEETAVFVASARNMLEELCKRNSNQKAIIEMLNAKIQETAPLHAEIERLKAALAEARDFIQDSKEEKPDLSFQAHDDATSDGCKMCGNEWKSLNKQGYCSSCWTIWNS
jgi:hypothetical protein